MLWVNSICSSKTCLFLFQGAFEGLYVLEWLKLDGNRLKWVKGLSILPLTLKGLSLEDNPWECDCHLLELRLWLADRNVASSAEPRCSTPDRTTNATIKSLPPQSFACFPQLSPTTMFQKIGNQNNCVCFIFNCVFASFVTNEMKFDCFVAFYNLLNDWLTNKARK